MDFNHGYSGYSNYKCRCDVCRIAWNAYCVDRRKLRMEAFKKGEAKFKHGHDGYSIGCRCVICKSAHANVYLGKDGKALYLKYSEAQSGKCAICKQEKKLHLDHDHKTGTVRGLLCVNCNTSLGKFGDSVEILQSAIDYLASPNGKIEA